MGNNNEDKNNDNLDIIKVIIFVVGAIVAAGIIIALSFILFDIITNWLNSVGVPMSPNPYGPQDMMDFFDK